MFKRARAHAPPARWTLALSARAVIGVGGDAGSGRLPSRLRCRADRIVVIPRGDRRSPTSRRSSRHRRRQLGSPPSPARFVGLSSPPGRPTCFTAVEAAPAATLGRSSSATAMWRRWELWHYRDLADTCDPARCRTQARAFNAMDVVLAPFPPPRGDTSRSSTRRARLRAPVIASDLPRAAALHRVACARPPEGGGDQRARGGHCGAARRSRTPRGNGLARPRLRRAARELGPGGGPARRGARAPMKLVILTKRTRAHGFGGVEAYVHDVARTAVELGHDVVVLATAHPAGTPAGASTATRSSIWRHRAGVYPRPSATERARVRRHAPYELSTAHLAGYGRRRRRPRPHVALCTVRTLTAPAHEWQTARLRAAPLPGALARIYSAGSNEGFTAGCGSWPRLSP